MYSVAFALLTRTAHFAGYLLGSNTSLYYWPVLACRKFEGAVQAILNGSPDSGPFVYASPLYRYLILPFYATGIDRTGLFIFQSFLGVLTAWLIFRLALRAGASVFPALAASFFWSLYAPAMFFELTILPVSLLSFLVIFFTLVQISGRTESHRASLSGITSGLISGLRPPFILMLTVPLWRWIREKAWKKIGTALLLLTLPLLFLSVQQKKLGGGFYPFPRTAGCNLVLGNSSESTGYGPPIPSLGLVETGNGDIHDVAADITSELGLTSPAAADRYWMHIALSWIEKNPLAELRLLTVKLGGFFGSRPYDTYYELGRISSFNPVFRFMFIPRMLISILFLLALVPFCLRGRNRAVILIPITVALLSCIVFMHSERYSLPVFPLMMAAGASGADILFRTIRKSPLKWLSAAAAGLIFLIPSLVYPVPSVPEEMFIGSLGVRAYFMEDYNLSLELFERAALLAEEGDIIWVQGHTEAAKISEALGYGERAEQHRTILRNWEHGRRETLRYIP